MVEVESLGFSKVFLTTVPNRSRETLFPLICEHVLPRTLIISDERKGYTPLDVMPDYTHLAVNQSIQFKDTQTGACTNKIEGLWSHLRCSFTRTGVKEGFNEDYLAAFIVKNQQYYSFPEMLKLVTFYKPTPPPETAQLKQDGTEGLMQQDDSIHTSRTVSQGSSTAVTTEIEGSSDTKDDSDTVHSADDISNSIPVIGTFREEDDSQSGQE